MQRNDEFTMFYTNFFVELYDIFSREKGSYRNDNYLILLDFIQLILFLSQCPQSSVTHLQLQSECNTLSPLFFFLIFPLHPSVVNKT